MVQTTIWTMQIIQYMHSHNCILLYTKIRNIHFWNDEHVYSYIFIKKLGTTFNEKSFFNITTCDHTCRHSAAFGQYNNYCARVTLTLTTVYFLYNDNTNSLLFQQKLPIQYSLEKTYFQFPKTSNIIVSIFKKKKQSSSLLLSIFYLSNWIIYKINMAIDISVKMRWECNKSYRTKAKIFRKLSPQNNVW